MKIPYITTHSLQRNLIPYNERRMIKWKIFVSIFQFQDIHTKMSMSQNEGNVERDQRKETNRIFQGVAQRHLLKKQKELELVHIFCFMCLFS